MKTLRHNPIPCTAAILFLLATVCPARAGMIANNYNDYGHAVNGNQPYCAATAFANSLAFLQNEYPSIYPANSLTATPNNPKDARNAIIGMQLLDGNGEPPNPPIDMATIWNSMVDYIESKAPHSTIFEGQQDPRVGTLAWEMADAVQQVIPTPDFLLAELQKGGDVEIGFTGIPLKEGDEVKNTNSHMVTLTGIDTTKMTLTYLDPNNPSQLFTADYTIDSSDYITFNWDNKVNAPVDDVRVFQAFAAIPVPEPSTFVLALIGLSVVWILRQRRVATVGY